MDRLPDGSRWWRCGGTVDLDVSDLLPNTSNIPKS